MMKRDMIKGAMRDYLGGGYTTSQTEMGFKYILNSQMNHITMIKNLIDPSDSDADYISMVLLYRQGIRTLMNLLANEIEVDTRMILKKELIGAFKAKFPRMIDKEKEEEIAGTIDNICKTYGAFMRMMELADEKEKGIISYHQFLQKNYGTSVKRRAAMRIGFGATDYHRYELEQKVPIETIRWEALIMLMKRHNLLLETEETLHVPSKED